VHELYDNSDVRHEVIERFGDSVAPDGRIDRGILAQQAFATADGRRWLEGLLWPRVGARIAEWRQRVEQSNPPARAAVIEVPLLFESGMEQGFDATIAVVAEEELRSQRAAARGHQALEERAARQLSQEEKAQRATYVVTNDGTIDQLESKLSRVLEMLEKR
jgi:dephospho-CoA kinase